MRQPYDEITQNLVGRWCWQVARRDGAWVAAKGTMAVGAHARAQAVAGEALTVGRRVHTVRQGQGRAA